MFTSFALYQDRLLLCFLYSPFQHYQILCIPPYLRLSSQETTLTVLSVFKTDAFFFKVHCPHSPGLFPFLCCLMITFVCIAFHLPVLYSFSLLESNLNSHYLPQLLKQRLITIRKNLDSVSCCAVFSNQYHQRRWYFCYLPRKDSSTCFSPDNSLLPTFSWARDLE